MISIRRISLSGGFRYLMESVAACDAAAERSGGLTRYYASSGTPPGVWVGAGLADLGDGVGIPAGEVVGEEQLRAMLGELTDPVSGVPRAGARSVPAARLPVAGFDLTFSPPKSVSVAWALADEGTKAVIYACHREAIEIVVAWAEVPPAAARPTWTALPHLGPEAPRVAQPPPATYVDVEAAEEAGRRFGRAWSWSAERAATASAW